MDTSDMWFTLDNRGGPIWGSRGREFKSRQPDSGSPNESVFCSQPAWSGWANVATGVATEFVTTGKPP
jgi:hypothetical protein